MNPRAPQPWLDGCHPRGWRARVAAVSGAGIALWLAGCASVGPTAHRLTPAEVDALRPPPSAAVTVVGPRGAPLSAATGQQVMAQVKAEGDAVLVSRHLAVMGRHTDLVLYRGNTTRLLIDGPQAFAAMFAAIDAARESVLVESYIIEDQSVAERLADALIKKRAAGVPSAMMYDDVGSLTTSAAYFQRLRDHGVAVCAFNPVNPVARPGYWGIAHRDHRKILAVDDQIAFTGGINISQVYTSGSRGSSRRLFSGSGGTAPPGGGWRDTQIQIQGPAAAQLAVLVRQAWQSQGCKDALPPAPTRATKAPGERVVQVLASGPDQPENPIFASLLGAIDASQRSVHLTMAYFAPGPDMLGALVDAAGRGVDVQLVLPSRSDFSLVLHAGRSYYSALLKAGVRIHELQSALLHAKTAVIDGVWSTVGSSNMDWRSFADNNEANVVVLGSDFADEVEAMFQRDLGDSQPVTWDSWRRRPLTDRAQEVIGRMLERLL